MIPPTVLRYFWLLTAAFMLVNVAVIHSRARTLVQLGHVSDAERRAFSRGAAVVVLLFCLLFQGVVWLFGESRPECLAAFPPKTPASWASSFVTAALWGTLLWWVWRGRGSEQLARFSPVLVRGRAGREPYSPSQVRRAVTTIVLLAGIGGAVASRVVPPPPDCGRAGSAVHVTERNPAGLSEPSPARR